MSDIIIFTSLSGVQEGGMWKDRGTKKWEYIAQCANTTYKQRRVIRTPTHTQKKKSRIGDKLDLTPLPERIWNEVIPSSFTRDRLRQTGKWYIIGLRGGEFVRVVNGNRFS